MNENDGAAPVYMTEHLAAYEKALAEFSASATEFMKHIPLLTKALQAHQQAITASAQLREFLDKGDQTMGNLTAHLRQTVTLALGAVPTAGSEPEAAKVKTIEAVWEKARSARV
jgi:exonuclease VII small subunit